jgi:hypothetical protein
MVRALLFHWLPAGNLSVHKEELRTVLRSIVLTILFSLPCSYISAQGRDAIRSGPFHHSEFQVFPGGGDTLLQTGLSFVLTGSDTVIIDSVRLTQREYSLNTRTGELLIHRSVIHALNLAGTRHRLVLTCRSLPFDFRSSYFHRQPVEKIDTASGKRRQIAAAQSGLTLDDLFNSNLKKSGTIVRGLSIGTGRDLTLNSGFRLQMSGPLSNDLEIVAALTDQNTPIQPEGTTQTLRELDQVFVEIRGNNLRASLGDFMLTMKQGEFGSFQRKLQGAQGEISTTAHNGNSEHFSAGAAATRGKFITNEFSGVDGLQGPYLLTGENGNRDIIAVAGTEQVFINGMKMSRGENSDYTVDYATASVTFTPHRPVTSGLRIVVDFEYNDRHYNRSLISAQSETGLFNNHLTFGAAVVHESDNENSPVDLTLSDTDKAVIAQAGGDPSKAVRTGVELVGPGKGTYIAVDTVVTFPGGIDSAYRLYRYNPADTVDAVYLVTFSYVGPGKGDYSKLTAGNYGFMGIGKGTYAPVRLLPLPQSHTLVDFTAAGTITPGLTVKGEYAASSFDPNTFVEGGQVTSGGHAGSLSVGYETSPRANGRSEAGSFGISLKERFVGKSFVAVDRYNDVEFGREWNLRDSTVADESMTEASLRYAPLAAAEIGAGAGVLSRGDQFTSRRYTLTGRIQGTNSPLADYSFESVGTRNETIDRDGNWIRQHALFQPDEGFIRPRISFQNELLMSRSISSDSLGNESYRLNEITPGFTLGAGGPVTFGADYSYRWDDSAAAGVLRPEVRTLTQKYTGDLREWHSFSSSLDLSLRKRSYPSGPVAGGDDHASLLLRWQSHYNPFNRGIESDWLYEVASERVARQERVFQRVATGTGNYVYLGDVNGNHIMDLPDFQLSRFDGNYILLLVPGDELVPVVNVKAGTRFRITPGLLVGEQSGLKPVLSVLTTETSFRVEENSTDPDPSKIYLLHFSRFLNDANTLAGNNLFSQDIYLFEKNTEYSLRFRYAQRKGLTQYSTTGERSYYREQSMRLRWQLIPEIANEINVAGIRDALASPGGGSRPRDVALTTLKMDWSYRPDPAVEVGFQFGVGRGSNADTMTANLNDQSVRVSYAIGGKGQMRGEVSREEADIGRGGSIVPFELTGGRLGGISWLWQVALDYQISRLFQTTLSYDGRQESSRSVVHTGRAEVRAFF